MSMNEFERQNQNLGQKFSSRSLHTYNHPCDFSEDDFAFAEELHALFSPEAEKLPPYYVSTLLDSTDQHLGSIERGFEYKTSVQVFRRLKLRRCLCKAHTSPLRALSMDVHNVATRRALLTLITTFVCVMLLTVAFTGPAFASGAALLLRGTHGSGAVPVSHFPTGMVRSPSDGGSRMFDDQELSLQVAQQEMHSPIYWPEVMPSAYSLSHINLYVGINQQWVDGPTLEFEYHLSPSAAVPQGTGEIWVREFKPKADVLQVVEDGASMPIGMDSDGSALAVYINGEWDKSGTNSLVWVFGQRSELIYQLGGVIFWIAGDQRDGVGEDQLQQIAQGLTSGTLSREFRMMAAEVSVQQLSVDIPSPFSNDVIQMYSDNSSNGPYYMYVSSYELPKNVY